MPSSPIEVGGRYRIGRLLAASGMADVYAATDERLDRPVALKFLRAERATDEARFRREMATLARLEHPNLVRLYDADVHDAVPYLVLELVDGPTLAQHVTEHGALDAGAVARLFADLASALEYVHAHGVVHRDVKPSNVLLDREGRARLTDFGIARTSDATAMTGTAMTIGTAAYLAPEQARGEPVGPAADVYSLGLVLLESLTATRAFPGPPVEAAVARLHRDPEIPPSIDAEWRSRIAAMTARDPVARPTAAELVTGLTPPSDGAAKRVDPAATVPMAPLHPVTATLTSTATTAEPPRPRVRRPDRLVGTLVLVGLAAAIAFGLASATGGESPDAVRRGASTALPITPSATTGAPTPSVPATTVTTAVAAIAPDCRALEAQKRALDDEKHALDTGRGVDQESRDAARRAIDERRKALDADLKACEDDADD